MVAVAATLRYSFNARVMYSTRRSAANRVDLKNQYPRVSVKPVAEAT